MTWAHQVRRVLRRVGIDVQRYRGDEQFLLRTQLLRAHRIDHVVDVGANVGQYATSMRRAGYAGRITSIEPVRAAFEQLTRDASADAYWDVCHAAVGAEKGEAVMNIAGNGAQSSSILGMGGRTTSIVPEAGYVGTEVVPVRTLDDILGPGDDAERTYLKLDVQGFEDRVLDGGRATLARARGLEIELSLVPLYEDSQTYLPLVNRLENDGFRLRQVFPVFSDSTTGEFLQIDGVFFRE